MWQDDGSGAVKSPGGAEEFVVEGKAPGGHSPVNARFTTALASGQYFEVEVLELGEEGCFIGVCTQNGFGQGWAIKGLFFGGNLSDGGCLVRQSFGDPFVKGMKIGTLVEYDTEAITVTFYQDARCLGPAFVAKRLSDAEVFPVVKANSDGDSFAIRFPNAPTVRTREPKGGGTAHPAEGSWVLEKLLVGPELGEFPLAAKMEGQGVTLNVKAVQPGSFQLSARVVNMNNLTVESMPDAALAPFERLLPGEVLSTRMMGPPGMMEAERAVSNGLATLQKWLARDGGLLLVGPAVEMCFSSQVGGGDGLPATEVSLS